jgi:hypothetical protein
MFRDLKDESLFFNKDSCLFFVEREVIEIDSTRDAKKVDAEEVAKKVMKFNAIRDADEVVKVTTKILQSSFSSSDVVSLMIRSSIIKSFSTRSLIEAFSTRSLTEDVIAFRCREFFFAFVVALMTKTVNSSTYLFSQSLDQFIEIARKSTTIFIK